MEWEINSYGKTDHFTVSIMYGHEREEEGEYKSLDSRYSSES